MRHRHMDSADLAPAMVQLTEEGRSACTRPLADGTLNGCAPIPHSHCTPARIFFEQVLHDNLDIGRPDQGSLIFHRRILNGRKHKTPGRSRTRVITEGVTPSLHVDYKNTTVA